MTLIVGILCEDGVAIASDKQATAAAVVLAPHAVPQTHQTSTARVTKVTQIGLDVLVGVSGVPAIGEEYQKAIAVRQQSFATRGYDFAVQKLKDDIREIIKPRLEIAALAVKTVNPSIAYGEAVCECVVAANFKDGHSLFQIQQHGTLDRANHEVPYRVIGSGQLAAEPFMAFLRNTFWPKRLPTVAEGVLAAYWAIDYAIEAGAPGVGSPIEAYKLVKSAKRFACSKVADDELKQHEDFIRAAREAMRDMASVGKVTPNDASQVPTLDGKS